MKVKILIMVLIIALIFIEGCITAKDCGTDINCFKEASKNCDTAKVNLNYEGTNIRVTLRGFQGENCLISFKVEEVGDALKQKYNGIYLIKDKTLNCAVPLNIISINTDYIDILKSKDILNKYCSGPLKDLIQVYLEK